jgi:hypothetical protein
LAAFEDKDHVLPEEAAVEADIHEGFERAAGRLEFPWRRLVRCSVDKTELVRPLPGVVSAGWAWKVCTPLTESGAQRFESTRHSSSLPWLRLRTR